MLVMLVVLSQQYLYRIAFDHTLEKKRRLNLNFANGKFTKFKSRLLFQFCKIEVSFKEKIIILLILNSVNLTMMSQFVDSNSIYALL